MMIYLLLLIYSKILGQQNHSSKFPCYLCYGFREDQGGRFPGSEAGRWTKGPLRSHNSNLLYYNRFRTLADGKNWEYAKEKYGQQCFSVIQEPIQLHHDADLAYIHYLAIDPLHTIKLGKITILISKKLF